MKMLKDNIDASDVYIGCDDVPADVCEDMKCSVCPFNFADISAFDLIKLLMEALNVDD